jgi:hypothetical protein
VTTSQPSDADVAQLRAEAALGHRLDELERDNRRLKRYTTTMLVVVALVLGLGAALVFYSGKVGLPGSPLTVSAQQFVLRDSKGTIRGGWGVTDDGSVRMALSDEHGRQRVRLSLLEDGSAGLSFADTADRKLAVLGLLPDHTTTLVLTDQGGIPRVVLGVQANGSSNLVFADQSGSTRAGLGVDTKGFGTFTLADHGAGSLPEELLDTLQQDQAQDQGDSTAAAAPAAPAPKSGRRK